MCFVSIVRIWMWVILARLWSRMVMKCVKRVPSVCHHVLTFSKLEDTNMVQFPGVGSFTVYGL